MLESQKFWLATIPESEKATHDSQYAAQAFKAVESDDIDYERFLADAAKDYEKSLGGKTPSIDDDFKHFIAEFEKQHPSQAKALQEPLIPRHERLALEAEKHLKALEKTVQTSHFPHMVREELEKYAANVAKQPEVMNYLKTHNKEVCAKIQRLAQSREQALDRDIDERGL